MANIIAGFKASKGFLLVALMLLFTASTAFAEDKTWSFGWEKNRSDGGEGFYNISDHSQLVQVQTLNSLQWTLESNSHATGFTASSGQLFGSAAYPIIHGTLSTEYLHGKIKKVTIEAKTKSADQAVSIGVTVGGVAYGSPSSLTTERSSYTFEPNDDAKEGAIVITMDQPSEAKGIIYFHKIEIVYEGEGVVPPIVEKVSPQLAFAAENITIESGDGPITNPLVNPFKVSPVTYSSSDESMVVVGKTSGQVFSMGPIGTATVTATFEGDDNYLPETVSYTVTVIEKPVIEAPDVDVKGGTFDAPVKVTITSNNPLCKAIWYSTTISNVDDLGYDEGTIIVPGTTAEVTIDKSCTLLCVAVGDNNVGLPATYDFIVNLPLTADFTAEESARTYYQMGWDSVEEASTWKYYGINETHTWTLTEQSVASGTKPFSSIDPNSTYSLSIIYDSSNNQRERAVSPEIEIKPNSKVEFYACFAGIWLWSGCWKLYINDVTADKTDLLINSFLWAQENAFDGPSWEKFSFDLNKYAGHTCTFEFIYEGTDGESVSIDGFQLIESDNSDEAVITIMQGQKVHFKDLSTGNPKSWSWTFEGGMPARSKLQDPTITYLKAGEYKVSLTVSDGNGTAEKTREKYVVVKVEAPKALIGIPTGSYLSPWAYAFVPVGVPVTYNDASTGNPSAWYWKFDGTDIEDSAEKNPTVTYLKEGTYGLELVVSNAAGDSRDFLIDAIKAGGSEDVWNITPEETMDLSEISMGWYGSYGGTNWLGMDKFAEHFEKPLASATIDNVTAYFAKTKAEDEAAEITVSICPAGEDGMPGAAIATSTLRVSDLQYDKNEVVPTVFEFDNPVEIDTDFFIVISGFPNTGATDDVSLLCAYRGGTGRNTAYHYLLDEDGDYNYLDTGKWYANTDDPLSMCLTAHMTYTNIVDGIEPVAVSNLKKGREVYGINGIRLNGAGDREHGIYIERDGNKVRKSLR